MGQFDLFGPDIVYEAREKVRLIKERLKMAYSRQKSYSDNRKRDLEFHVVYWVYLKILPMKGVMRFGIKGRLSPCHVAPYEIFKKVGEVVYDLKLTIEFASVHSVFNMSILKKCIGDTMSILQLEDIGVNENLSYEDVPVKIMDHQVKKLRNKEVSSVKVIWINHLVEGVIGEAEADMKSGYPHIFPLIPS